jgi:Ca-activated chloride channel homolog
LKKAMSFPRLDPGLSRSFIVVTDGYVNVEKEAFDIIRTKANEANTFAFGIGSSVNRYIIDGMAHVGMSEPCIILNPDEAVKEADKFRNYISNPVLTQIKKSFNGLDVYDIEPASVPDVFAERPVVVYGKYRGKPNGTITIEGFAGKKKYKRTFDVAAVKADPKHAAVRYLWARKKIQLLDDYKNLGQGGDDQLTVTNLGLKYNLITAYTSFVAVEEVVANTKGVTTVKQPLPMPEGVENSAVGFEMEIDEEEVSFSYHKKIELPQYLDDDTKQKLQASIERKLIPDINKILSKNNVTPESIVVTVDMNGNVAITNVKGKNLPAEVIDALKQLVAKQVYTKFKIHYVWKYTIEF